MEREKPVEAAMLLKEHCKKNADAMVGCDCPFFRGLAGGIQCALSDYVLPEDWVLPEVQDNE